MLKGFEWWSLIFDGSRHLSKVNQDNQVDFCFTSILRRTMLVDHLHQVNPSGPPARPASTIKKGYSKNESSSWDKLIISAGYVRPSGYDVFSSSNTCQARANRYHAEGTTRGDIAKWVAIS